MPRILGEVRGERLFIEPEPLGCLQYVERTCKAWVAHWPINYEKQLHGCATLRAWMDMNSTVIKVRAGDLRIDAHPGGWADPDN